MIVIVFPQFYGVHGIARYLQSFLAALDDPATAIIVIVGDEDARPIDAPANVEFVILPLPTGRLGLVRWSLATRRWLLDASHRENITVINLHIPPLLPGLFLPRVAKIVVTAHTTYRGMSGQIYSPRQFRSQWNPVSVWIKKLFERYIFARADGIVTLTEQGLKEVRSYGFRGPIEIAPNGVDLEVFTPGPGEQKTVDVLFAGRIERRKGSRPMVDVCRALVAKRPDISICIVGYGDDFEFVQNALGGIKNVQLTNKVSFDKMLDLYRGSQIYASTSYYEGLPGTCLEAMAVGLPAVVWDCLFYKKLVIEETTGKLVPINDVDTFANTIIDLLSNPSKLAFFGAAAHQHVTEVYGWRKIASQIMSFLR